MEPNKAMRQAGEDYLASYDAFRSIEASAEATSVDDAGVDFVTAGQSFHWFEPDAARQEFMRIIKPGGWMVIAWNDRRMEEAPFTRDYEGILERFGSDYKNVKDSYPEADRIRGFLSTIPQPHFPNHHILNCNSLRGRLRSSSFTPAEGHPNFAPIVHELRKRFHAHQQNRQVPMPSFTRT